MSLDVVGFLRQHGIAVIGGTRAGLGAVDRLARWSEPLAPMRPARSGGGAIKALQQSSREDPREALF